jgi:hypothetical protein
MATMLNKIVSSGQTGADRAALDFAIKHKIPHSGWVPKGRLVEDVGEVGDILYSSCQAYFISA